MEFREVCDRGQLVWVIWERLPTQKMASCSIRSIRSSSLLDSLINVVFVVGFVFTNDITFGFDFIFSTNAFFLVVIEVVFSIESFLAVIAVFVTGLWSLDFLMSPFGREPNMYVHSSTLCQVSVLDVILDDVHLWLCAVYTNYQYCFHNTSCTSRIMLKLIIQK